MSIEDMCPERLRNRFRDWATRWPTIDDVRQEIADWLSEEAWRAPNGKAIGAVSAPEAEAAEEEWEETYVYDTVSEQWLCGLAPKRPRLEEASDGDVEMTAAATAAQAPAAGKGGKGGKEVKVTKVEAKLGKHP